MKWGWFIGRRQGKANSLEYPEYLANLLAALSGEWDTPALIAYLADDRARLLLCKALVSPVSGSDRQLAQRAYQVLRVRGIDPERLKKRLEPAAVALGLGSACDIQIDYYDVLGMKHSATNSEIRSAYRKKAFEIHPDTAGETHENSADFVTLKAAYDTLMDPNSRAAFDQCQVQLDSWYEEDPKESHGERKKRQPQGKFRKASYRVAAVVAVMVVIAWVLSIMYERETMLELVRVTESGPTMEMAGLADIGEVENKAPVPVFSEVVEDKAASKPAAKKPAPKKLAAKKLESKKLERVPLKMAGLEAPLESPELEQEQVILPPPVENVKNEKPKAAPVPEPVEAKVLPSTETAKMQVPVLRESRKKKPKDVLKLAKKEGVKETPVVAKKKQPKAPAPVRPRLPENLVESPVQQTSATPPASEHKLRITSSSTDKVQTKKSETNVSEEVEAQATAFSVDPTEYPVPPKSSLHAARVFPRPAFPETPLPKTHKTPFVQRSQVLAFLKKYTAAYERGNAEVFFSCFTVNAVENGNPLMTFKPDYLEIWDNVQSLDYRIFVNELNQLVGSDTVSMKGRFDLDWKFVNGRSGQSRGDISMDLELNKNALQVSRLTYSFDGEE
ncbi:MAG: DnaJ domain-containing protein [Deltaproteobacteria bacterium]|nr:DnaJ domain-containing protein [Deltaproteobacteria bacterium]